MQLSVGNVKSEGNLHFQWLSLMSACHGEWERQRELECSQAILPMLNLSSPDLWYEHLQSQSPFDTFFTQNWLPPQSQMNTAAGCKICDLCLLLSMLLWNSFPSKCWLKDWRLNRIQQRWCPFCGGTHTLELPSASEQSFFSVRECAYVAGLLCKKLKVPLPYYQPLA